jgi:hypothetical protein
MPAPNYRGSFPVRVKEETNYSDRGKIEYTITEVYQYGNSVTGTIGSTFSFQGKTLVLSDISVNSKDGLTTVAKTYTGGNTTIPELYEVVSSLFEEPIASHPAFTIGTTDFPVSIVDASGGSIVEGTLANGGALFDSYGGFMRFTNQATNNLMGVQSYLSPRVSYRRIFSSGTSPTSGLASQVGKIFSTPRGDPPSIGSGRNWILASLTWKSNGNEANGQFEITEEYKSSGLNGWNDGIYYTEN